MGVIVPAGSAGRSTVEGYDPKLHDPFFDGISGELADKGWANTRIAKEIGSTASTVKADVDWLTANEGYARPEVVPAR